MLNSALKRAAAVAVLAGASVGANAATQDVGIVRFDVPTSFNALVTGPAPSVINETILFMPEGDSIHSGVSVMNFPITLPGGNLDLNLMSVALSWVGADGVVGGPDDQQLEVWTATNPGQSPDLISFSSTDLLQGDQQYYLTIAGSGTGSLGAALNGAIEVTPVPEPESFAMLLAGLGLMGAVVRRRSSRKTS